MIFKNALAALRARNQTDEMSPPSDSVKIGDEQITVRPVGIEDTIRLTLLLAPYVATFQKYSMAIAAAVAQDHKRNGEEPSTLRAIIIAMTQDIEGAPGDILKVIAIFLSRDVKWIAEHATGEQIVTAIPIIDAANDLAALIRCTGLLGFIPGVPLGEDAGAGTDKMEDSVG